MIAFWTLLHGLLAIALVGAITHQGLTVLRRPAPARHFVDRYRSIAPARFATAIAVLYLLTFTLGAWIYPVYVLDVKGAIAEYGLRRMIGVFQLKEHLAVIGLCLLPVYWHFWHSVPLDAGAATRRFLTTALMLIVWWSLVAGHVLNNQHGLT